MFVCFYICLNEPIQQSLAIGLTTRTMYCTSLSCICLVGVSLADSMRCQSFLRYRILSRFTVPALGPGRSLLLWVCFRRWVTPFMLACLLTVLRLTWGLRGISDLKTTAASVDLISRLRPGHGRSLHSFQAVLSKCPNGKSLKRVLRPRFLGRSTPD